MIIHTYLNTETGECSVTYDGEEAMPAPKPRDYLTEDHVKEPNLADIDQASRDGWGEKAAKEAVDAAYGGVSKSFLSEKMGQQEHRLSVLENLTRDALEERITELEERVDALLDVIGKLDSDHANRRGRH